MKKALLIITLFIGIGSANAQYDATWKETVTFIQNYSPQMYNYNSSSCQSGNNEISIEGKVLIVKFNFRDGSGEVTSKVDLSKLENVSHKGDFFEIKLIGDYIESNFDGAADSVSHSDKIKIKFCDIEYMDRVYDAFKHLTKLASKKRT